MQPPRFFAVRAGDSVCRASGARGGTPGCSTPFKIGHFCSRWAISCSTSRRMGEMDRPKGRGGGYVGIPLRCCRSSRYPGGGGGSKNGIGHCRGLRCFLPAKLLKASFQRLSIKKAPQLSLRCHFFERNTGFGPATSGLGSARSTN